MNKIWLPKAPYAKVLQQQIKIRQGILSGEQPECLMLVEHLPCITLGKRGGEINRSKLPPDTTIHRINRGGLATWHGPGQLVCYPLLNLRKRNIGVRSFVCGIENIIIEFLRSFDLLPERRKEYPGIWLEGKKIASVGLEIRKGISSHGFAVNISNHNFGFEAISPCGIADVVMTTLAKHVAQVPTVQDAGQQLAALLNDWIDQNSTANY